MFQHILSHSHASNLVFFIFYFSIHTLKMQKKKKKKSLFLTFRLFVFSYSEAPSLHLGAARCIMRRDGPVNYHIRLCLSHFAFMHAERYARECIR